MQKYANLIFQQVIIGYRKFLFRILRSQVSLRILGDIPRDLLDFKRGFSYEFEKNGELELIQEIGRLSHPGSIFFDVGANFGEYTQALLDNGYLGSLHLFEIDTRLIEGLRKKFPESNSITVNDFGLSNSLSVIEFNSFLDYPGANSLFPISLEHLKSTKSIANLQRGDDYCNRLGIDKILFLKIDVEGWERFVLEGLTPKFLRQEIEIVAWEYGYVTAESSWTSKDFFNFFESKGYVCGVIRPNGVKFQKWDYALNDWKSGPNFLACLPTFKSMLEQPIN